VTNPAAQTYVAYIETRWTLADWYRGRTELKLVFTREFLLTTFEFNSIRN